MHKEICCTIFRVGSVIAFSLPMIAAKIDESEHRLPLTPSGYLKLKPYFQEQAVARTDLYFSCPQCTDDAKLRITQKHRHEICLNKSVKVKEATASCKGFSLTVASYQHDKKCHADEGRYEQTIQLSNKLLSHLQRQEASAAKEAWASLNPFLTKELGAKSPFAKLEGLATLFPSYRNTKLRWYLKEADDTLAAKFKIFLGITFYLDERGKEQTRYEVEAKLRATEKPGNESVMLCGFFERNKIVSTDIDSKIHSQQRFMLATNGSEFRQH